MKSGTNDWATFLGILEIFTAEWRISNNRAYEI
jgi:hypothetical protein